LAGAVELKKEIAKMIEEYLALTDDSSREAFLEGLSLVEAHALLNWFYGDPTWNDTPWYLCAADHVYARDDDIREALVEAGMEFWEAWDLASLAMHPQEEWGQVLDFMMRQKEVRERG
jgi:hypothetical protein